jgi:cobalt-precorrin-7 (C5)-methyltransferase
MRDTLEEVRRGKIVFLLADPKFNVAELYSRLTTLDLTLQVALCENLAYKGERIIVGDLKAPPQPGAALYSLVIGQF